MNQAGLAGVQFVPTKFTPTYSVFKGQACQGVSLVMKDREKLASVDLGIAVALALQRQYPTNFALTKLNSLLPGERDPGSDKSGKTLTEIKQSWAADLQAFKTRRERYLIY